MRDVSRQSGTDLDRLVALVERLRAPDGCPWDREQTLPDLRAYLLEEAHEVADAIDRADHEALAGELGDLLFQIAFIARLEEESGSFSAAEPVARATAKMIARHPHVFDLERGGEPLADARAVREAWERRKLKEGEGARRSLLDGATAASLPALVASYRLTQKAAGVGFDWPDAAAVVAKVDEELAELKAELAPAPESEPGAGLDSERVPGSQEHRARLQSELGDLLFALANLARHLELDPEAALAGANLKFRRRFAAVEAGLEAAGRRLGEASLAEMDALWEAEKARERATDTGR